MEKKTNQEPLGLVTEISHIDSLKLTFKSKIEKIKKKYIVKQSC